MSDSRRVNPSRRTIVLVAAVSAVTAAVTVIGMRTLTGSGSLASACPELIGIAGPLVRMNLGPFPVAQSEHERPSSCVAMTDPVLVDSGFAVPAVPPGLLNAEEVFDALTRSIPGESDEMGTEGMAMAHFLVDEAGVVQQQRIEKSSGSEALDEALLAIAPLASFSPAETDEGPTEAWVAMTVAFHTEQSGLQRLRETLDQWRNQAEM